VAWKPLSAHLVWAALSRAVRAPARIDRDFYSPAAPPHFLLNGGPSFRSELADVAELGVRGQAMPTLSYSVTGFYSGYDRLRTIELVPGNPPEFGNGLRAGVAGVEGGLRWRVRDAWRIDAGTTQLLDHRWHAPGSADVAGTASLGNDPAQWWTARTSIDLPYELEFDAGLREVGALPQPHVPSYTAVDARLGWRARPWAELSVAVQNAFDTGHPEWGVSTARAEFPRAAFVRVDLRP
jgi:iron complex outermembrane receptor protein